MPPGKEWLYHAWEPAHRHLRVMAEENSNVSLPSGHQWCVTHRPYPDCQCGHFTLEWQ